MSASLTPDLAVRLARIALGHVTREFPNAPEHVQAGAEGAWSPKDLHPVFYGSFDWPMKTHNAIDTCKDSFQAFRHFLGFGLNGSCIDKTQILPVFFNNTVACHTGTGVNADN